MNPTRIALGLFAITCVAFSQTQEPVTTSLIAERAVATLKVPGYATFLGAGEGGVWTLNQGDGSVSCVDPKSNRVIATIPVGAQGAGGDIATGVGRVWVRAKKVLLSAIDPRTNRVTDRFGPPSGSGAVRVGRGLVWVSAHDIQTVWVLRP